MVYFKLGVDNCFAVKRWPEAIDWAKIVKNDLKLNIIEYDSDFLDPLFISQDNAIKTAKNIGEIAKKEGLFIHNYFTGEMTHCVNLISHPDKKIRKDGLEWIKRAMKIATAMDAKGIGGHFDTIPSKICADSRKYKYYIDYLIDNFIYFSELAYLEKHEILMLEQMYSPYEVPYTLKQTHEILERINTKSRILVSPVIDLGHACCQNFDHSPGDNDPYMWLKEFASIVEVVHLQQTTMLESNHWPFTKKYNELGIIEPNRVLNALEHSTKKEIYLIFEIFFSINQTDKQVIDSMIETVNFWKKYI
jgi:D-erythrulose 1-phosphate 3-epimerase